MKNTHYIFSLVILLSLSACAPRIQFTQAIKVQHQLKEAEIKKIQFYTTSDIIMQRAENSGSNKETNEG